MRLVTRASVAVLLSLVARATAVAQEPVPVGEEFLVNTYTSGQQWSPQVAIGPAGTFIIVWGGPRFDPWGGVKGQRFDASGNPLGAEFKINTSGTLNNFTMRLDAAVGASGRSVVVWNGTDILAQRLGADGERLGGEFRVNSYTTGSQLFPQLAIGPSENFVVVWASSSPYGSSGAGVFGQHFDGSGIALGEEFQVNTYTTGWQSVPAIASSDRGDFVVVWTGQDGSGYGIFGRRLDSSGILLGEEFQINTYTTGRQQFASVAASASGDFVVVWESPGREGGKAGIVGQRFDNSGAPLGEEFRVNTNPREYQTRPRVASERDESFVVTWSTREPGVSQAIVGQRYDPSGSPVGGEFQVTDSGGDSDIAAGHDGRFVVTWERPVPFFRDIFAQRHAGPGIYLEADGPCPGQVTASLINAPPNSEVAIVAAANTNGFIKGGPVCSGAEFEVGEPLRLPPTFVIVDGEGRGFAQLELKPDQCWLEALSMVNCETSVAVQVVGLE